ncbi:MAG: dUTP diphosphatase [Actinomycetota bacterium]|nr:dUTP diphosphatase [Actinomycetota bacterium]
MPPSERGSVPERGAGPARVRVTVRRLDPSLPLPAYAHPGDAGADLSSRVDVTLDPGQRALVPTGLAIALPDGYAGFTHPRSGLATRHGVTIVNAPGTLDSGYRGEILVNLVNLDPTAPFHVRRGDRIAQLVIQQVAEAQFVEADSLPGSLRGETGHGASGGFGPHETLDQTLDETRRT